MKRILSLALSLALVLSLAAVVGMTVSAEDTETELLFSEDYFTTSDNTANMGFQTSYEGYKMIVGKISEGTGVTLTSIDSLEAGLYDVTLYARARGTRPLFDIEVNGTVVGEAIDTSNTVLGTDNNAPVKLTSVTIPAATNIIIKITGSAGITENYLYLNSIKFTKTADYTGGDTVETPTITMDDGAAMRIDGTTDGLRFSATVDQEALNEYTANVSKVAEQGMLIAKSGIADADMNLDNAKVSTLDNYQTVDTQVVVAKYDTTMETVDDAGVYKLYGSLVKIDLSNANQGYVAKAYIKFENGTVAYSAMSQARTINEVAAAVFADKNYFNTLCDNHKEAVTKWL